MRDPTTRTTSIATTVLTRVRVQSRRFPAERYVMVDDKIRILSAMKSVWADRLTTVFVRQGHYAADAELCAQFPAADVTIERIADLDARDDV